MKRLIQAAVLVHFAFVATDCFTAPRLATRRLSATPALAKKKSGAGNKRGSSHAPKRVTDQLPTATSVDAQVAQLEQKLAELKAKQAAEQAGNARAALPLEPPPVYQSVTPAAKAPASWPPPPPAPEVPFYEDPDPLAVGLRLDAIGDAIDQHAGSIVQQLKERGVFVVDGLLGAEACAKMRAEAEALHRQGFMVRRAPRVKT
jgi:hypothetical protein